MFIVHPTPRHLEPGFGGRQTRKEGTGETVLVKQRSLAGVVCVVDMCAL